MIYFLQVINRLLHGATMFILTLLLLLPFLIAYFLFGDMDDYLDKIDEWHDSLFDWKILKEE